MARAALAQSFPALLAATLALALSSALAGAQDGIPEAPGYGSVVAEVESNENVPDTDTTPKAKRDDSWTQVGGALFPHDADADPLALVASSPTAFDVDLHKVSFRNTTSGIAVGSACRQAPEGAAGESAEDYAGRVDECERVPVIYQYSQLAGREAVWREAYRGDGAGYAGAVAWIDSSRAVVVGGTGTYPYRNPAYKPDGQDPGEPYGADQDHAGEGRAWIYCASASAGPGCGRAGWEELDLSTQVAQGMRGMTAVDFHPGSNVEFGAAGALGQIWEWEAGGFARKVDAQSPVSAIKNRRLFTFRVREIRFYPLGERVGAFAVTDGCCAEDPLHNQPVVLAYGASTEAPRWHVRKMGWDPAADGGTGQEAQPQDLALQEVERLRHEQALPDSLYSVSVGRAEGEQAICISGLYSPGGEPMSNEPASVLGTRYRRTSRGGPTSLYAFEAAPVVGDPLVAAPDPIFQLARTTLTSARFVAGDGDTAISSPLFGPAAEPVTDPAASLATDVSGWSAGPTTLQGSISCGRDDQEGGDAVPDWVVGELKGQAREGLGAPGLAWGTHLREALIDGTIKIDPTQTELTSGSYRPTSQEKVEAALKSRYRLLSSYGLNGIDMIGTSGTGWAVGARGAMLRISETVNGSIKELEPDPPGLGAPVEERLSDDAPYDDFAPLAAADRGGVPALHAQPHEQLARPELMNWGSPDPARGDGDLPEDVADIAMSRDGEDGWAVGPNVLRSETKTTSLFQYRGGAWTRCDPLGTAGQRAPDRECVALAGLRRFKDPTGGIRYTRLVAIARVPNEGGGDEPTNDDEFEAVAVGTDYRASDAEPVTPAILRYRDGRWAHEEADLRAAVGPLTEAVTVEFTAPDDGWLLAAANRLFHFDGERWSECGPAQPCGDAAGLLNLGRRPGTTGGVMLTGLAMAGERIYAYGYRATADGQWYPLIAWHQRGEPAWHSGATDGGYDPLREGGAVGSPAGTQTSLDAAIGEVYALGVTRGDDGRYQGWATGAFGGIGTTLPIAQNVQLNPAYLLRLAPAHGGEERWAQFDDRGALGDYVNQSVRALGLRDAIAARRLLVLPDGRALIAQPQSGRLFEFRPGATEWRLVRAGRPLDPGGGTVSGSIQALASDEDGGAWVAMGNAADGLWGATDTHSYFFRYSDRRRRAVFSEAPNPLAARELELRAMAGAPDGTLWTGSDSSQLARYDRRTGWEVVSIPGWDPGRFVTRTSEVNAIAVAEDGEGVAVGRGGRIADIQTDAVTLDAAAGVVCGSPGAGTVCGTSRNLTAVAAAPGGAAMAGGEARTVLWRPAGGQFRAIEKPPGPRLATITGVALEDQHHAFVTLDNGAVFRGETDGSSWRWGETPENVNATGDLLTLREDGEGVLPLRAIAVAGDGRGYAVGDQGVVLQRQPGTGWRRLVTSFRDNLTSLTLTGEGEGALIGGESGLLLTVADGMVELARTADFVGASRGPTTGPVVGVVAMPGLRAGGVEAWAAIGGTDPGTSQLLHYASEDDPLVDPGARAEPLPDAPEPRPGELAIAAFGKTECHATTRQFCWEPGGTTNDNEVIAERIVDEILARSKQPGGPKLAVFTGDAADSASTVASENTRRAADLGIYNSGPFKLRRWRELVLDRLNEGGLPAYGAIGAQDLSETFACDVDGGCHSTKEQAKVGDNAAWRQAMSPAPAPWGEGAVAGGELDAAPVSDPAGGQAHNDVTVDPDGAGPLPAVKVPAGGARTHYAVDIKRGGKPFARLVVVDSSLRLLAAADPLQQPLETHGGQTEWLERMLCVRGTAEGCSREEEQAAIVLSNTPTYSYGPGVATDTATDATAFEQLLIKHNVSAVVSGRLGWNGLYWATAPGVHEPCPGSDYQETPPQPGTRVCGRDTAAATDNPLPRRLGEALGDLGAPPPPSVEALGDLGLAGLVPFVVASGGGGKFGPDGNGNGSAADGYWHGYSIVRLDASGDPAKTIVEQRPVHDWLMLTAQTHVMRPRQKLTLRGIGREPLAADSSGQGSRNASTRFNEIDTPAITHRYDLIEADPERPWLPKAIEGNGNPHGYVPLAPDVAWVESQTGMVRAGRGNHGRMFALAVLSVGDKAATWPLVFEPKRSYVPPRSLRVAVPAVPEVRVLGFNAASLQAPSQPPPSAPPPPINTNLSLPAPPALPGFPPAAVSPVVPPAPPAPPPPPGGQQGLPTTLSITPVGLTVPPTTGVTAQPTPPVNPSPPSGARREAKQRQAATAKSEEGGGDNAPESQSLGGDLADSPRQAQGTQMMTRRDRVKPSPAGFTPLSRAHAQPSAWTTGLQWGGGVALMALALALGFTTLRPTPRSRPPVVPSPAWLQLRR